MPPGAVFDPRVGDFATIEVFLVNQERMSAAADVLVGTVLPVIRERGGLREVWLTRDDTNARFVIVSAWAEPVAFQQWQMSEQRLSAYQALGPFLTAQPSVQTVSLIGLISGSRR